MVTPKDFMGREIKEGDTLVYPVRRGGRMWLKRLIVLGFLENPETDTTNIVGENEQGRRVNLIKSERSVIVEV